MKFVADDGRIFNNYEACKDYERTHGKIYKYAHIFYDSITLYDKNGNISEPSIDIIDTENYWNELMKLLETDHASYINICEDVSEEEWDEISNFIDEEYRTSVPTNIGIWRYDWNDEEWVKFSDDIKNFCAKWNKIFPNMMVIPG